MIKTRESGGNYAKGLEFYDQGLLVDALAAFEAVLEGAKSNSPEAKLARFYIGETHARLAAESLCHGARAHAEKHLREALARNPKYPDLHYQLALVIAEEGLLREAMKELDIALNLSPNYAKALLTSGILAYQMGDYDEGAKRIVRAASLESRYDTPIFQSALDDHNKGDNCRALAGFQELALTNIDDISFYYDTGKNLYRSGDYKGSVEAFEQALSVQSNYPDIRNWLGLALMACGKNEEALEQFQAALEINPKYVAAMVNAGDAYRRMDMMSDARSFYTRALKTDPENIEARDRLAGL